MPKLNEVFIKLEAGIMTVEDLSVNTQLTIINKDGGMETVYKKDASGRSWKAEKSI